MLEVGEGDGVLDLEMRRMRSAGSSSLVWSLPDACCRKRRSGSSKGRLSCSLDGRSDVRERVVGVPESVDCRSSSDGSAGLDQRHMGG